MFIDFQHLQIWRSCQLSFSYFKTLQSIYVVNSIFIDTFDEKNLIITLT